MTKFNELEYDIQFDAITLLYSNFEKSIFCVDSLGEYESMLNYLKHKYHAFYIESIFTRNNGYTFKLEFQFTLQCKMILSTMPLIIYIIRADAESKFYRRN
jgi:hypothetical protein